MIHDLNKKAVSPLSVFHASVKSDFILKKGARGKSLGYLKALLRRDPSRLMQA